MYENQISTATLGGHGIGGKIALAAGCYYPERITGYIGLDTAPLDHRYHESYKELKNYVIALKTVNLTANIKEIENDVKAIVKDPYWRKLFIGNLQKISENKY